MFHKGARTMGGNMKGETQNKVVKLLDELIEIIKSICQQKTLQRAVVRSQLTCSIVAALDKNNLYVFGQSHFGMPSSLFIDSSEIEITPQQALVSARWEFGFEDPFLIVFPKELLDKDNRNPELTAIAMSHIESEFQRVKKMINLIQINPLFGPASYTVDERLAFVLMPFQDDLTRIYKTIIKPTVEKMNLVCKRADELKTNKAIIQDIWKAICESRLIIADLTGLNPNVMYELGMAHTVGKETILIYQVGRNEKIKFPFDLTHIRRIEYEDSATGGKKLENELFDTIKSITQPVTIS